MHPSPDDLALLALGEHLDRGEQDHVRSCPVCGPQVEDLRRVVHRAREVTPEDALLVPAPHVWDRIHASLSLPVTQASIVLPSTPVADGTRPTATVTSLPSLDGQHPPDARHADHRRPRRGLRVGALAVAAAALAAVGFGVGVNWEDIRRPNDVVSPPIHLNALPDWEGADGRAEVVEENGDRVMLVRVAVPQATSGSRQVWLSDENARMMILIGTLEGDVGRWVIPAEVDLDRHPIVDVSEEPVGDTNTEHDGPSIVRGRLAL